MDTTIRRRRVGPWGKIAWRFDSTKGTYFILRVDGAMRRRVIAFCLARLKGGSATLKPCGPARQSLVHNEGFAPTNLTRFTSQRDGDSERGDPPHP
jgi:hypothetical protein